MTLIDKITADLAKNTEHPQTTEVMTRLFLVDSKYRLDAVFEDREWAHPGLKDLHAVVSTLAGMCAYLLDQLHQLDGGTATDVAWQLHDGLWTTTCGGREGLPTNPSPTAIGRQAVRLLAQRSSFWRSYSAHCR